MTTKFPLSGKAKVKGETAKIPFAIQNTVVKQNPNHKLQLNFMQMYFLSLALCRSASHWGWNWGKCSFGIVLCLGERASDFSGQDAFLARLQPCSHLNALKTIMKISIIEEYSVGQDLKSSSEQHSTNP